MENICTKNTSNQIIAVNLRVLLTPFASLCLVNVIRTLPSSSGLSLRINKPVSMTWSESAEQNVTDFSFHLTVQFKT